MTDRLSGDIARTVLGPADPATLGPTLMHEHVICDIRPPETRAGEQGPAIALGNRFAIDYGEFLVPRNLVLDQEDVAAAELALLHAAGGRTLVELSCGGLSPDPEALVRLSRGSGVAIVMGCGHYVDEYQDEANRGRTVEQFADEMVAQVTKGAWGTEVRAGIIGEIGCQAPWTALERRVMRGAVIAQGETGAALSVHPGRDADQPRQVAAFVAEAGGDLSRTILSHIDRTIFDQDRLFRLADTGAVIEFDLFGQESAYYCWNEAVDMPNDAARLRSIRALIDRGHLAQITISQDICYRSRLCCNGGHGYGHIFRNVVPLMRRRDFDADEIDTILVRTPRRLLTLTQGPAL